jgi:alpha-glucosidase
VAAADRDDWWRGAVIYQVYPRSFQDTDGDGIGDLAGITQRLGYIAALGVDVVWISPFFKSPMKDFGYDVADYRTVDPMFGRLEDFELLLERAHALGLKVLVDMVLSHTSSEHAWFVESREDRTNPRADWYVWADPKPDGTPPNNWLSIFGGMAWEWEPRREHYYLHNFLREQPDLNFRNPEVVRALMDECEFWLRRGVDGFRLDALDFAVHDAELRDNPVRGPGDPISGGLRRGTPYAMQRQRWSKTWRDMPELILQPLRALADRYPGTTLLAELSGDESLERMGRFTSGGGLLDMAYSFDLLSCPFTAQSIREVFRALDEHLGEGWPCWSFSNHDVVRAVTRWGGPSPDPRLAPLLPALLTSLPGSVCLYQGEELGLTEAELAFHDLRDPVGITFWPRHKGRDGARTPMPWLKDRRNGGFSDERPWLPVPLEHLELSVDAQDADADSTLNRTRAFLRWRKAHAPLLRGDSCFLDADEPVLAFERAVAGERLLCAFNLSDQPAELAASEPIAPLTGHGFAGRLEDDRIRLPGYEAFFGRLGRED